MSASPLTCLRDRCPDNCDRDAEPPPLVGGGLPGLEQFVLSLINKQAFGVARESR